MANIQFSATEHVATKIIIYDPFNEHIILKSQSHLDMLREPVLGVSEDSINCWDTWYNGAPRNNISAASSLPNDCNFFISSPKEIK